MKKEMISESRDFVTKIIITPPYYCYGKINREIILKRKHKPDLEFQLSGFGKDIPVIVKK